MRLFHNEDLFLRRSGLGETVVAMTKSVTDNTHVSEARQQVEGEEGLRISGGMGPAH